MAKAIYSLKLFIFLAEICSFIVNIYLKAWFTASRESEAPHHDLKFLKQLYQYKSIEPSILETTLKKFVNHAWYLSSESSAMAFFDGTLSNEIKQKWQM